MSNNNFDDIEVNYNGDFDLFMDDHVDDMFWPELKRRARLFFDEEFIGWVSTKGVLIEILSPCELYIIDSIISHKTTIKNLIDYTNSDPVEIIMYFESLRDNEEEKNWDYNPNPDDYDLI